MKKIISIFLCLALVLTFIGCAKKPAAETEEPKVRQDHALVAIETPSYKVTNGMLSYYYLSGFYNLYANYLQSAGIDYSKPLSEQEAEEDLTWHQYFLDIALSSVYDYLYFAEEAKAAGFEVDDLAEQIDDQIQSILMNGGVSLDEYITRMFGDTLDEADLRASLELQLYAIEYYNSVSAEIEAAITAEDVEAYFNENLKEYSKVDYITYNVIASTANTDDTESAYAEAQKDAEELVALTATEGVESAKSWIAAYMTESNGKSSTPMSEEALAAQIEKTVTGTVAASYIEDNELAEWAFETGRATGDCKLTDNGAGSYTVAIITKAPYRDMSATKNVRHILLESEEESSEIKAEAEKLLSEWKAGDATEESFAALAEKHSDYDISLYENVYEGEMPDAFNDWCFDTSRAVGDTGIIKTDYGYHIMYFIGEGLPLWEKDVREALLSEKTTAKATELQTKYADSLTENKENIDKLPDTIPESALQSDTQSNGVNIYG